MRTRSYSRGAIAILLTFGLVSGGGIAASATTPPPTSKSIQDNESFEDDLADGFEVLFTEILQLDSNGTWKINEGELSKHPEIDRAKINEVALALTELERLEEVVNFRKHGIKHKAEGVWYVRVEGNNSWCRSRLHRLGQSIFLY